MGGRGRPDQARCEHAKTVSVASAGLERDVCETCGYVSFRFVDELSGDIVREAFAREVERPNDFAGAAA